MIEKKFLGGKIHSSNPIFYLDPPSKPLGGFDFARMALARGEGCVADVQ